MTKFYTQGHSMVNSKKLFVLALGLSANMLMNANNIDRDETLTDSAIVTVAATITTEKSTLQQEATPSNSDLQTQALVEITSDLQAVVADVKVEETETTTTQEVVTPTEISLQDAQAFGIEGLELTEGTTFVHNGILYIIITSVTAENNPVIEASQK